MLRCTFKLFASGSTGGKAIVTVLGGSGGIGQPFCYEAKKDERIKELRVCDLAHAVGVAADLSHIPTPAVTTGFAAENMAAALKGADIVVVPAGVPRKPGMSRDDLFNMNAKCVYDIAGLVASECPKALICIITNPVNSTVPIVASVLRKRGVYDPKRLFGVTALDLVRAKCFVNQLLGTNVSEVPVIGGHSGPTIVPLLSGLKVGLSHDQQTALTKRIQYGGDEVVNAKAGAGSATLSMAYAGWQFVSKLLDARSAPTTSFAFTEVDSSVGVPTSFFSTRLTLGPNGITGYQKVSEVSSFNAFEKEVFDGCVKQLDADIKKGLGWSPAQ